MFDLKQIIELFSIMVIVASFVGMMWLAGHIYFKYQNWKQEHEEKRTPPSSGHTDEQEKIISFWRD